MIMFFHYTCASPDMACQNVCYGGLLPKLSIGPVPYGGSGENSLGKSMEMYFFMVLNICTSKNKLIIHLAVNPVLVRPT